MFRKKKLVITFLIFSGIAVYYFITNIKATTLVDLVTTNHNELNQHFSTSSLIAVNKNEQQLKSNEPQSFECSALDQAYKTDKENKATFISTKAIQWHFEGHDKYKIAETLAAMFSYYVAMQWLEDINSLSRNHEKHSQLMQTINSISYTGELLKSSTAIPNIDSYKLSTIYGDDFDIDIEQRFNQYPDLAILHWGIALNHAFENKNIENVLNAINELKTYNTNPLFFKNPLTNGMIFFRISSFTQVEIDKIIDALFDLSPIFVTNTNHAKRLESLNKQQLRALGIDKSLWKFKYIKHDVFEVYPVIKQLIEQVKIEYPALVKHPSAEDFCSEEQKIAEVETLNVTTLAALAAKQTLSPAWQGVYSLSCTDKTLLGGLVVINRKLNIVDINLDDLNGFKNIQKNSIKLEKTIDKLDAYESNLLFSLLYQNRSFEFEQVKKLIGSKVTPTNSDLYLLLRHLPFEQQKELLIEHQYDLAHSNYADLSLIVNAVQFNDGSDNFSDELIPFLIEQGFPLKESESSIDPLWLQLMLIGGDSRDEILPIKTISSLINQTELNETHINAMYHIKRNYIERYKNLIVKFPELKFDEPEKLIEINC